MKRPMSILCRTVSITFTILCDEGVEFCTLIKSVAFATAGIIIKLKDWTEHESKNTIPLQSKPIAYYKSLHPQNIYIIRRIYNFVSQDFSDSNDAPVKVPKLQKSTSNFRYSALVIPDAGIAPCS